MPAPATVPALTDSGIELHPDPSRTVTRFYVPGREDVGPGDSRAAPVIERLLHLPEADVVAAMADVEARFSHRHRDLHGVFHAHAANVRSRLDPSIDVSPTRHLLLGACFTHEYSIEGAALCNPSAVLHPVQDASGDAAFVMSVRSIGEGHKSTIGFRTGTVTAAGAVTIDAPGPFPQTTDATPGAHEHGVFHAKLAELGDDSENAAFVLDGLPAPFDDDDLAARIEQLLADGATRRRTATTIANLRRLAGSSYRTTFPDHTDVSERVLWPQAPSERQGMEDARFVRFMDDDGNITYLGTYTAFDGDNIAQHLLETDDFASFAASPMAGAAATGKGLAIFPRRIGGRYVALSRSDRETNTIAFSEDLHTWATSEPLQSSERSWEILQLGNCGSPIETDDGWLVLTHGVGPMRTYSLGAILLDLDDPTRVRARSSAPILAPAAHRRDGYVPNVVYSCGGFTHGDVLVLPYGFGDQAIAVATLSMRALLASLTA